MKKIIYLVLAVCMLLTAIPFVGYATETTDTEQAAAGKVCRIGDVYYDTLDAAFAAVKDNETITMIADYAQKNSISIPAGITVTLNGNGKTLTRAASPSGTLFGNVQAAGLTLENVKYQSPLADGWGVNQMICAIDPTGDTFTLTIKSSEITLGAALVGEAITKGKTLNIKLENSTLSTCASKGDAFFNKDCTNGTNINIELDHSTINVGGSGKFLSFADATANLILRNGSALNLTGNTNTINAWNAKTVINVELYGSQIVYSDGGNSANKDKTILFQWTNCNGSLKMDGTSTVKTARTNAQTGSGTGAYLWRLTNGSNVTLDLAKGAVIEMADTCGSAGKNSFFMLDGGGKVTIDDKGAEWKVSAELLKKGFALNDFGGTQIGWTTTGKLYAANAGIKDEQATAGVTLQIMQFQDTDFDMVTGAATRIKDPYGLRFDAWISADFYNRLAASGVNLEMGFVIAETEKVIGSFNTSAMAAFDYEICKFEKTPNEADGKISFWKALYDFSDDKASLSKQYSAMAYLKLQFADGTTQTIYTTYDAADHARSVYDVAKKAIAAGANDAMLLHIVSVAEA